MKKYNLLQLTLVISIALVMSIVSANASEFIGTVSTGVSSGVEGTVITAPSASPTADTYTSTQNIALTVNGATSIRYTTDGTEPTCSTPTTYHVAIPVSESLTIKAISCYPNGISSSVSSFTYVISSPTPAPAAPSGGGGGGGGGYVATPTPTPNPLSPEAQAVDVFPDGKIDILDFNVLMGNWGGSGAGDVNHDGVVDILDFNMLMANWS